jgi:hypothetical protein
MSSPVAIITPLMEQQLFDDWCPYKGNPDPRPVWAAAIEAVNGLLLANATGAVAPSVKVNQCGETCERARLCAACSAELTPLAMPTGSPLNDAFLAWWEAADGFGGSIEAACRAAFKVGAASPAPVAPQSDAAIMLVPVEVPMDAFENAIRNIGPVAACEWFGHRSDSEFTQSTILILNERLKKGETK